MGDRGAGPGREDKTDVDVEGPTHVGRFVNVADDGDHAVTLDAWDPSAVGGAGPKVDAVRAGLTPHDRYRQLALLGEGGMGAVHLCHDRHIGRRIAMKVMQAELDRAGGKPLRARFLREARVQGQLEHPSIVPVYDLGAGGADDKAFFTMKCVRGVTLDAIIDRLRSADAETAREYTPHKLLGIFAQVCLAVHYAHARGVIHRDLKPANLMVGGFGEVYVLDWGLAKIVGDDGDVDEPMIVDQSNTKSPIKTAAGAVLGTPAYAAPEQLRGEPVDPRTDVWALGAILFEILTLETLNPPHGNVAAMLARTLKGLDARCSVRAPHRDVPPELEQICVRATLNDPAQRFQSPREMEAAIERFLSGDRDRDARKKLALEHEAAAHAAATEAHQTGSVEARARALAEVGRALALDPESRVATTILYDLVDRAPRQTPPEVAAQLEDLAESTLRRTIPSGGIVYSVLPPLLLFLPLALWMGPRSTTHLLIMIACVGVFLVTGAIYYTAYRLRRMTPWMPLLIPLASLCVACASPLVGPFFLVPTLATINAAVLCASVPRVNRAVVIAIQSLAVIAPVLLELLGVGPATHEFTKDGSLCITSSLFLLPRAPTLTLLIVSSVFTVAAGGLFLGRFAEASRAAEARRLTQKWQIEQLLPREARVQRTSISDAEV